MHLLLILLEKKRDKQRDTKLIIKAFNSLFKHMLAKDNNDKIKICNNQDNKSSRVTQSLTLN
jgi:hypothetical protein